MCITLGFRWSPSDQITEMAVKHSQPTRATLVTFSCDFYVEILLFVIVITRRAALDFLPDMRKRRRFRCASRSVISTPMILMIGIRLHLPSVPAVPREGMR